MTTPSRDSIIATVKATFEAADGDSNDEEIQVLQEARDMLMQLAGITDDDLNSEPEPEGVRYPHVTVQLTGQDANAFFMIGRVRQALRDHGVPEPERTEFANEAMSGDYDHVLTTIQKWVTVR